MVLSCIWSTVESVLIELQEWKGITKGGRNGPNCNGGGYQQMVVLYRGRVGMYHGEEDVWCSREDDGVLQRKWCFWVFRDVEVFWMKREGS